MGHAGDGDDEAERAGGRPSDGDGPAEQAVTGTDSGADRLAEGAGGRPSDDDGGADEVERAGTGSDGGQRAVERAAAGGDDGGGGDGRSSTAAATGAAGPFTPEDVGGHGPELTLSATLAAERRLPGWPAEGQDLPGPPAPVPPGRGGAQRIPRPLNARLGAPPPWAEAPGHVRRPTLDTVRGVLLELGPAVRSVRELSGVTTRPAAVLAPLYEEDGEAVVLLTRRTWSLRSHRGEVSFPGGRVEAGESPAEGALRETHEEIGLDPSSVELIGELDHLATVTSGSFIVPLVGALAGRPDTRPNPAEVDAVLHVSLAELLDPSIYREELWTFPGGVDRRIFFFELVGDTLWGATAAMLRQLLGLVTGTLGRGDLDHL